ncbi:uncharacterized protein LOC128721498 [Anopheles nili]|uniref:uncharacterized protein LOC128721498 n=1 Tax=Anopheles nili TaxID=185578 RepID=UPI00237C09DB|nr:uncharacterized protein LOC128721498 [Anopheles nili]
MKVLFNVFLLLLVFLAATGSSPLFSRKLGDWRDPWSAVAYRERLQSWGLYPKVFRYGTTNHRKPLSDLKRAELNWLTRIVRDNEEVQDNGRVWTASGESIERDRQYERFKEKHFQKMEQDAMEVLWRYR